MSTAGPEFEYLPEGDSPPPGHSAGRRRVAVAAGAVAALAVVGGGAYGVMQFMSSGDSAATAVPASALGYLALDLDPSGGQKVAAYETMRKFPALKEQLGLADDDDPRRWIVDAINSEAPQDCRLEFADDVEPWLGDKLAVAVVDGEDEPQPFVVMEVSDTAAAEKTVERLFTCDGGEEEYGTATVGDFMVVAPAQEVADEVAADAESNPLSDDETFQARMEDAGDAGVLTGYLAPAAVDLMLEEAESAQSGTMPDGEFGGAPGMDPMPMAPLGSAEVDVVREYLEGFEGAAMQLRFADAGLEVEMTASGISGLDGFDGGTTGITDLPGETAFAYGFATGPDVLAMLEKGMRGQMSDAQWESSVQEFEQETGLAYPEDVEALLGDGITLAADSSIDFQALEQAFSTGQMEGVSLPVGLRIVTDDPAGVVEVTDKLQSLIPPGLPLTMQVEQGDGAVAVGVDPDYVDELAGEGALGETTTFQDAVPDGEDSAGALYVDFDAQDWLDRMVEEAGDPEVAANTEALSSLGISSTYEGDEVHALLRLTTD